MSVKPPSQSVKTPLRAWKARESMNLKYANFWNHNVLAVDVGFQFFGRSKAILEVPIRVCLAAVSMSERAKLALAKAKQRVEAVGKKMEEPQT